MFRQFGAKAKCGKRKGVLSNCIYWGRQKFPDRLLGGSVGATPTPPTWKLEQCSEMDVGLTWKAISNMDTQWQFDSRNIVFTIAPNPGLYSQFSLPAPIRRRTYVPFSLLPTTVCHQTLRRSLFERFGISVKQYRFPYKLPLPHTHREIEVNFRIRLFVPNTLSITIEHSKVAYTGDLDELI